MKQKKPKPIMRSVKLHAEWWELARDFGNGNVTEGLRQGLLAAQELSGDRFQKLGDSEIRDIVETEAVSELERMQRVTYHQAIHFAEQCVKAALAQAGVR